MAIGPNANPVKSNEREPPVKNADKLSDYLYENARSPLDTDAAQLLRKLGRLFDVAYELVHAKTHDHSKATYAELVDMIKGKAE